jgi:hypothetical protein
MLGSVPVLVSYSPEIGDIDHGYYVDLLTDVTLAIRFCLTGKWTPIYGAYTYVHDFSGLCEAIETRYKASGSRWTSPRLGDAGTDPHSTDPELPRSHIVHAGDL